MHNRIKSEIYRYGFTITSAAAAIHISTAALSKKILGQTPFTWEEVKALRKAIGSQLSVEEFMEEND